MFAQDADTRTLRVFGLINLGLYIVLVVFFWTAWSFKKSLIDEVVFLIITVALAVLYFVGLKFAKRAQPAAIVVFAIAIALIGFIAPPFDSTDVFFYMATGWQQSHYGANPYSKLLRNTDGALDDPMIQNEWMARNRNPWLDIPIPYGFLFALLARGIAWFGHGDFWFTLMLFNLLNLTMHVATALLLWRAGDLLPERNGKVLFYLYSWNPFVLLQYLADLHNDIIVGFLVVLAAYLLLRRRPVSSLPLLVAASLIKYVTIVLLPFVLVFLIRRMTRREILRSILVSVFLIVAVSAPYIGEITSFKYGLIWAQVSESSGSFHAFVVYLFRAFIRVWPGVEAPSAFLGSVTKAALWIGFAIFILRELQLSWKDRAQDPLLMVQRWTSILFALIFVASSQFYAWYIGMMFPLALLTHRKTILADCVIALSGAHVLSFTFLRRKAIGYFLIATALPVAYLLMRTRRERLPRLAQQ
jgi:hypothetical protein